MPLLVLLFAIFGAADASAGITLTDAVGRKVELDAPARRILVQTPQIYPALVVLDPDVASRVVGIAGTANDGLSDRYEGLSQVPRLGWTNQQTFSTEAALLLKPDLVIANTTAQGQQAIFEKVGVPVIYVDVIVDPINNIESTIRILGTALDRQERSSAFRAFHTQRMNNVFDRIERANPPPQKIALIARRNDECCMTIFGWGLARYLDRLKVDNIAGARLGRLGSAQLGVEFLMKADPDVYVTYEYSYGADTLFGEPKSEDHAVTALGRLSKSAGLRETSAIRHRRVHALMDHIIHSPLNFLAVELLAKWIHPELFSDVDPRRSLDAFNSQFMKAPLKGPFWASLDPASDRSAGERR